jgi:DNA-binding PadR family transcriptional regulator
LKKEVLRAWKLLCSPLRFEIVKIVIESGEPMGWSDIRKSLRISVSHGSFDASLHLLARDGLIRRFRGLKFNPATGRVIRLFYEITEKGRIIISTMEEAMEKVIDQISK